MFFMSPFTFAERMSCAAKRFLSEHIKRNSAFVGIILVFPHRHNAPTGLIRRGVLLFGTRNHSFLACKLCPIAWLPGKVE
jgi:hypothetical protein